MIDVAKLTNNDKLMACCALLAIVLFSALVYVYRSELFASGEEIVEGYESDEEEDEEDEDSYEQFSGYS